MSQQVVTPPAAAQRGGRRCVHMAVDEAGQDEFVAVIDELARGRRSASPNRGYRFASNSDIAVGHDRILGDHGAGDYKIEGVGHGCCAFLAARGEARALAVMLQRLYEAA
jgi:hypothetical protein